MNENEEKTKNNDDSVTKFEPGTFVLVEDIQRIKGKPDETFREGPYEVVRQERNMIFLYDDRYEATLKEVHVSRRREYFYRQGENLRQLGADLSDKTIVEYINDHKFMPSNSRTLKSTFVAVKWSDEDRTRWEPLSYRDIRRTITFVRYAQDIPELRKWTISVADSE